MDGVAEATRIKADAGKERVKKSAFIDPEIETVLFSTLDILASSGEKEEGVPEEELTDKRGFFRLF